jgi:hypothetical protein
MTRQQHDCDWHVVSRWLDLAAEYRANLLRVIAVTVLYLVHLANHFGMNLAGLQIPPIRNEQVHNAVTVIVAAWTLLAISVQGFLSLRFFPKWLKYVTTTLDILLLTLVLRVSDGPRGPLVAGYFLILATTSLRSDLWLVRFATCLCAAAYLGLGLVDIRYPRQGQTPAPYYQSLLMLASLALAGLIQGQVVRQAQAVARAYAARRSSFDAGSGPP